MSRALLSESSISPAIRDKLATFHNDTVREVVDAVEAHDVVVVGMGWNPHVKRARSALQAAGIDHTYLEYGNYSSEWRKRLALKMWAGWPTFPMVFINHQFIGGADETDAALADGSLTGTRSV